MNNKLIAAAAINLALVVVLGAFGAHGLKPHLSTYGVAIYETAVQYHGVHALGMLVIGSLTAGGRWWSSAAICLQTGIILFCGSLYLLAISNIKMLGMITPIGGVFFIVGWIVLAFAAWKQR